MVQTTSHLSTKPAPTPSSTPQNALRTLARRASLVFFAPLIDGALPLPTLGKREVRPLHERSPLAPRRAASRAAATAARPDRWPSMLPCAVLRDRQFKWLGSPPRGPRCAWLVVTQGVFRNRLTAPSPAPPCAAPRHLLWPKRARSKMHVGRAARRRTELAPGLQAPGDHETL
jgi:hypothetical protein